MAGPRIGIVSLDACNVRSVEAAFGRIGTRTTRIADPASLENVEAIVLPGVANAAFLARAIDRYDLRAPLLAAIAADVPLLGICAGFQMLFDGSEEGPDMRGLQVFSGTVRAVRGPRRQHVGWNRVDGAYEGWGYFAHAFAPSAHGRDVIATTTFGDRFASVAKRGSVVGVQFHPERSGAFGMALLASWVRDVRCVRVG